MRNSSLTTSAEQILNPRQELIALLRGYAACPILSRLGELGFLDRMLQGRFIASDFPEVVRPEVFEALLNYLVGLGLVCGQAKGSQNGNGAAYSTTPLGKVVFRRFGSACLMHSYQEYFERVADLMVSAPKDGNCAVNRERNVLGSGQLHCRKFFPPAYQMLATQQIDRLIDIGCGDGTFMAGFHPQFPHASLVGVDISEIAISAMKDRLRALPPGRVYGMLADGFDVESWVSALPPEVGATVVTAWFVVHEFSHGQVERAIAFFAKLQRALPTSEVVVGEIVNIPADMLAASHEDSIMPEFLLFHTLSGLGVLTWEQHAEVLQAIPYRLETEVRFDEVPSSLPHRGSCPSSFIWHLRPATTKGVSKSYLHKS